MKIGTMTQRFGMRAACSLLALVSTNGLLLLHAEDATQEGPMPGPSKEHAVLAADVGTWDATVTLWTAPDAEPMKSKAVETTRPLGETGLWYISEFRGQFGPMPFEGHGQFGYDPVAAKYIGTWIDSLNPYLSTIEGDFDQATHTLTMLSTGRDPHTGKVAISKMIARYLEDDHRTFEMHAPVEGKPGEYWKMMEIHYQRRAEATPAPLYYPFPATHPVAR